MRCLGEVDLHFVTNPVVAGGFVTECMPHMHFVENRRRDQRFVTVCRLGGLPIAPHRQRTANPRPLFPSPTLAFAHPTVDAPGARLTRYGPGRLSPSSDANASYTICSRSGGRFSPMASSWRR